MEQTSVRLYDINLEPRESVQYGNKIRCERELDHFIVKIFMNDVRSVLARLLFS